MCRNHFFSLEIIENFFTLNMHLAWSLKMKTFFSEINELGISCCIEPFGFLPGVSYLLTSFPGSP
jgi:hypothetical protein